MQGTGFKARQILAVVAVAVVVFSANAFGEKAKDHRPITRELMQVVKKNPEVGRMLKASIAKARKVNPNHKTNPVRTLKNYYTFIDSASELIPRDVLHHPKNLTRDQILQSLCYFYFLVDQPLPELKDKGLFNNAIQYYPPFSAWLRDFAKTWGAFLDTAGSWGPEYYKEFYDDPRFGLQKGWYEDPSNWNTFNRFFCRYLKSPAVRPIASPDDPAVVASPADSVPQGVWPIDKASNIHVAGGLKVKLVRYFNVSDLLGKDSAYAGAFANGVLTHTFLNVNDYHRYHFAVGGTIKEKGILQRNVALEVAWDRKQKKYVPIDSTGWQFSQTLGYVIVDTGKYGLVALIPMGMAQVSSVNFEDGVQVGTTHQKGEMLGNFLFGGSDFIMLFQKKAGFEITTPAERVVRSRKGSDHAHAVVTYTHILMGEEFGRLKGE